MRKLNQLEAQFSKKEILQVKDIKNIKGGQRYITKNYTEVLKLLEKLKHKGSSYKMSEHNGAYCIEW